MIAVRSFLYVALFYLWTVLVCLVCTPLLFGPQRWSLRMFNMWGRGVLGLLTICGIKVELRGRENIPRGAAIVAPKHQCMLDVFAQFTYLPGSVFVMKRELGWIPWFGWYAARVGTIPIDRSGHASALKKMVRQAKAMFAKDRQVVIFPEGTRGQPGVPGDYKPGVAALYRELDVPVYPVATNSGVHWPAHGFLRHPGTIVFEYLEPIPPGLKRAEFMRILEERIETASARLLAL
ncbi:lysophospholipid acyltransferase family protein [Phenylobacterium sp.]|uniref:lysophospholipid acyltransferase family protein n=1 Tax=Phenylobacterium sp. TaxID=1871053 RepID=UPI002DEA3E2D|nr:lysophospholipid acyltransferase family protein [Phenylobacterium sp.]